MTAAAPTAAVTDLGVIGAGPGGVAAAIQARRLGLAVRVFERCGSAGGLVSAGRWIENLPGVAPMPGPALAQRFAADLQRFGVAVEARDVVALHPDGNGFAVCCGDSYRAITRAVVVAVGSQPLPWPFSGAMALAGERVFDHVRVLLARLPPDHPVPGVRRLIVVGAGEAGVDQALTLAEAGWGVDLLTRGAAVSVAGRLRAALADHTASRAIHIHTHWLPREVVAQGGGVCLHGERAQGVAAPMQLTAEAVLVAVGRQTAIGTLLDAWPDRGRNGVATGVDGLFVVGDARLGALGQAGIAIGDGLFAAMAASRHLVAQTGA